MLPCTMPNRALRLPAKASFERRAQRRLSCIDFSACLCVAGYGVQSSKIMAMSESSARCTRIDSSGVSSSRSPLIGEANFTPSSVILRSAPRLNTWKPPESVRIGASQPMKRCRPPCLAITSVPGRSHRWKVLPSTIWAPTSFSSAGDMAFTVP